MNQLVVNSRAFYNELLNNSDFATNPSVYSDFFKALVLERVKFSTSITVKTSVSASSTVEILFETDGVTATWTHPYANWATEGFKVGNTFNVNKGASNKAATIASISGNVMTSNDSGFAAALTIVSGTSYPDLVFQNTTVPTSLVFKFGIIPNAGSGETPGSLPSWYKSWLDDSVTQAYSANGIAAAPTSLTGSMVANTEITESITCEYISTANGWEHTFEVNHIFKFIGYKDDFTSNFVNETTPTSFIYPNAYRYVCNYLFGTDATDPNEFRIFTDSILNGNTGWIGNNFTAGTGDYDKVSCTYVVDGDAAGSAEATETTYVTAQIQKTSGNFVASDRLILYVMKVTPAVEYQGNTNTFAENFLFDSKLTTYGAASVNSDIINGFTAAINADPTLLDISFNLQYDATQQGFISEGDLYFIGVQVGQDSDTAAASDRKIVWLDVNTFTKNSDITGLITNNSFEIYSSEKTPNGTLYTTNADSWNNRLHQAIVHFDLTKNTGVPPQFDVPPGITDSYIGITSIKGQIIALNTTLDDRFVLDSYDIPIDGLITNIGGGYYQIINQTNYRDFNIKSDAQANKSTLVTDIPGSYQTTQEWIVRWPFVFNWREWAANPNVPFVFYDDTLENNNQNYRTSNYSVQEGYDIYIRLLVTVNTQDVNTDYEILSSKCYVRDFDVDPDVDNWTAVTELLDESGTVVNEIRIGQDMTIKTTFSMATAGSLMAARLMAEHTIEEYQGLSDNSRLHSVVDWYYPQNLLKPLATETKVKITQNVSANEIVVESLIDKDNVDPTKSYNIYTHLEDIT